MKFAIHHPLRTVGAGLLSVRRGVNHLRLRLRRAWKPKRLH